MRESFMVSPLVGLAVALLLGLTCVDIDDRISEGPDRTEFRLYAESSRTVIGAVGPAMLTFLGVVFSITLVALQMASGNLSPRVVRMFIRSRVTKATLTVFIGTFVFTMVVQYFSLRDTTQGNQDGYNFIPFYSGLVAMLLVLISVAMFVVYVHETVQLMRVTRMIDRVTDETVRAIDFHRRAEAPPDELVDQEPGRIVTFTGSPGVLQGVRIGTLVRRARRNDTVIRLLPRVGDFVAAGTPVFELSGSPRLSEKRLMRTLDVGAERTMFQDVAFGLRQLVDIAIRALSPAVNDPTTAVQSLDRVHIIMCQLASLPLGPLVHRDRRRAPRVIGAQADWSACDDLAFTEIRICGAHSPQVTRRLAAILDDLATRVSPDRLAVVDLHRALLAAAVDDAVSTDDLRAFALTPDRQGIG